MNIATEKKPTTRLDLKMVARWHYNDSMKIFAHFDWDRGTDGLRVSCRDFRISIDDRFFDITEYAFKILTGDRAPDFVKAVTQVVEIEP